MEPHLLPPQVTKPVAENWCYTRAKVDTFTYIWTINYFSLQREGVGEPLNSSQFSTSGNERIKWYLSTYPSGVNAQNRNFVSLYLTLTSCYNRRKVMAKIKFAILNDKREEAYKWQGPQPYRFVKGTYRGCNKFIDRALLLDEANGLLPGDTLTIFCEVIVVSDNENLSGQSNAVQFKVPECRLSKDLGSLLENGRFSDVTLSVRGREFRAHKIILAERSAVFAAMFEHDMEEQKYNRVNITDVDHEVFKEMLSFIYTGRAKYENIAQDLLPAADKYALERLKVMCEEALCKSLSVDKAVDILILADRHSASQLKAMTIDYIYMHAADVMQTQEWKKMIVSHPHLIADVLGVMAVRTIPLEGPPRKRVKRS